MLLKVFAQPRNLRLFSAKNCVPLNVTDITQFLSFPVKFLSVVNRYGVSMPVLCLVTLI